MSRTERQQIISALRTAAAHLIGAGSEMTGFFEDWPEPRNWDLHVDGLTAFGTYSKASYQCQKEPGLYGLFVEFEVPRSSKDMVVSPSGDFPWNRDRAPAEMLPGTFEIRGFGKAKKGKWETARDIDKVLKQAEKWGEQALKKLIQQAGRMSVPGWDIRIDGAFDLATYKNFPKHDGGSLQVFFEDLDEALTGGEGTAQVHYEHGADYQGAYGVKEYEKPYSSVQDMKKILKEAERFFEKQQATHASAVRAWAGDIFEADKAAFEKMAKKAAQWRWGNFGSRFVRMKTEEGRIATRYIFDVSVHSKTRQPSGVTMLYPVLKFYLDVSPGHPSGPRSFLQVSSHYMGDKGEAGGRAAWGKQIVEVGSLREVIERIQEALTVLGTEGLRYD